MKKQKKRGIIHHFVFKDLFVYSVVYAGAKKVGVRVIQDTMQSCLLFVRLVLSEKSLMNVTVRKWLQDNEKVILYLGILIAFSSPVFLSDVQSIHWALILLNMLDWIISFHYLLLVISTCIKLGIVLQIFIIPAYYQPSLQLSIGSA